MLQVVQNIRSGETSVKNVPVPFAPDGGVLVAAAASLISAGTERHVVQLARKSLFAKARERPDQVKRILEKLRQEGVLPVVHQVVAKLDEPMSLGYSSAGVVLECGKGVQEFKPGDRVAIASPHAEVVAAGRNLCAAIPENVGFEQACYASVAAIALQGVRLARLQLGESVLVIGLGLVGQLTVMLLKAQGCRVFGVDPSPARLELAKSFGTEVVAPGAPQERVEQFSGGYGVDATIITASTDSNGPIEFAAAATRPKGRIVLVGVAGLNVPRAPFFAKELEFTVSSSLGAGRLDRMYAERGVDYPIGYARWTVQRNMDAALRLMGDGKLPVERLTTHQFDIEQAESAYALITGSEPAIGVVLKYGEQTSLTRRIPIASGRSATGRVGVSLVGAGNFARLVLLPAIKNAGSFALRGICTANGLNAVVTGEKYGFAFATTALDELLRDEATSAVVLATRHDLHAEQVVAALRARKNVFVEKPLCIRRDQLEVVRAAMDSWSSGILCVGFNRRFSPSIEMVRKHFPPEQSLSISYRFSAGAMPADAWPQDEDVGGGRLVGEACHAIDTCTALAKSPPVRIFAESTPAPRGLVADERVMIVMRHRNGSLSTIWYDAAGDRGGPGERIEVMGNGRTAVIDDWNDVVLWESGKQTVHRGHKDKGHRAELKAFIDACTRGGPPPMSWDDVYHVSLASLLAVESLRTGLPMRVCTPEGDASANEST